MIAEDLRALMVKLDEAEAAPDLQLTLDHDEASVVIGLVRERLRIMAGGPTDLQHTLFCIERVGDVGATLDMGDGLALQLDELRERLHNHHNPNKEDGR